MTKKKPVSTAKDQKPAVKKYISLAKILPWVLIVAGIIGTLAAAIITYDKIVLAGNPDFKPACSIDPILSCGNIMMSDQAAAFWGLPNPFLGLMAFPVMVMIGVTMLAGATVKKRWYWLAFNGITFLGVLFCHWLFYESVYTIGNLCVYCMAVWLITFTSFVYITLYNIEQGYIVFKAGWWPKVSAFLRRHHVDIVVLWTLIVIVLILKHFWYYYGPKFGF